MIDLDLSELTKYNNLRSEWSTIKDFLNFLKEHDVVLAELYGPERLKKSDTPIETMLADFYEVDLIEVEKQKSDLVNAYMAELESQ